MFFAFFIRLIFALIQRFYQLSSYIWDEKAFHYISTVFSDYLRGVSEIPFDTSIINSVSSYGSFLGTIYFIFGQDPIIGRLISVIFGTLVVFLSYKIAEKMNLTKKACCFISIIVAFTPSYIYFSGLIMRDVFIWFLMYLFIYTVYELYCNKNKIKYLIISLLTILPLILLRQQYALLFAIYFIFVIIHLIIKRDYYFINLKINFIKYIFFIFVFLLGGYFSYNIIIFELNSWDSSDLIKYFSNHMSWRAQGGSAYLQDLEYNSAFDVIKNIPLRFYYFVYGPFIWASNTLFTILVSIENILVWTFSFLFIKRIKYIFDKNNQNSQFLLFLLFFIFIGLIANSIIDSNFGTAMRHRMLYIPLFFIITLALKSNNLKLIK